MKTGAANSDISFPFAEAWFDCWRSAFLTEQERAVTVGGLPMILDADMLGPLSYARLRSQTNLESPRFDVLAGETPDEDVLQQLLSTGADVVRIEYLSETSALFNAVGQWGEGRWHLQPHAVSPVVDCCQSYETWLARRSKRHGGRWRKLEAQVMALPGARVTITDNVADIDATVAQMLELEQAGWKGRQGTAILDDPRLTQFYTTVARAAAAAGAWRVAMIHLHDRLIAFEYAVLGGHELYALKVGYDEQYEHLSIGHILARMHIRACCADPAIHTYDKLGNGMMPAPYKLRFADRLDPLYRLSIYAPTVRGEMVRQYDVARHRAKKWRDQWRERHAA